MKIAILCGGEGQRLRPFTEEIPKALVHINGKPILEYILELYLEKKLNDFILCIGYKGEKIRDYISEKKFGSAQYTVTFSDLGEKASMLERINSLADKFDDRLLVSYGDTLTNLNIHDFISFHELKGTAASIVTAKIQSPFGLVEYDEKGIALSFDEKPVFNYYIGHILLEKRAFRYVSGDLLTMPDGAGLVAFLNELIINRELAVYQFFGKQITFNTHGEREKAEEMIKSFYTFEEN